MTRPTLTSHHASHHRIGFQRHTSSLSAQHPPMVHDHATLNLCTHGEAEFWMHGTYTMEPGDVLLVPEGSPHYVLRSDNCTTLGLSLCLGCLLEFVADPLGRLFQRVRHGESARRTLQDPEQAQEILLAIERELETQAPASDLAIHAHLGLLIVTLLRTAPHPSRQASDPLVARALTFIETHALDNISLRDVATHVHRSPAHLSSVIRERTGETVVGWITRARLATSRQLLLDTDETIEAIALRCGFSSTSHFHRTFKAAHNLSPGRWRTTHQT